MPPKPPGSLPNIRVVGKLTPAAVQARRRRLYGKRWRAAKRQSSEHCVRPFAQFVEQWVAQHPQCVAAKRFASSAAAWRALDPTERTNWATKPAEPLTGGEPKKAVCSGVGETTPTGSQDAGTAVSACARTDRAVASQTPPNTAQLAAPVGMQGMRVQAGLYEWVTDKASFLGLGSYGAVWLARHMPTGSFVAAKVYNENQEHRREVEFLRRAHESYGLHAPFPSIFFSLDEGLTRAVVMDKFDLDVRVFLKQQVPNVAEVQCIVAQIALALRHLHAHMRVLHLDVKPSNMLFMPSARRAALTDFSLAENIGVARPSSRQYCTLNYRPPEFVRVDQVLTKDLAPAADLWSFGCSVWEIAAKHCCGEHHKVQVFLPGDTTKDLRNIVAAYLAQARGPSNRWAHRLAKSGRWASVVQALCCEAPSLRVYRAIDLVA